MIRKSLAFLSVAALLAFAAPAALASSHGGEVSAVSHYSGIQKGEHILFHAQWTGFAIQQGIEQRSFSAFWQLFNAQSLCADDTATNLLFTPKGWGTGAAAVVLSFALTWFGRRRKRPQWRHAAA